MNKDQKSWKQEGRCNKGGNLAIKDEEGRERKKVPFRDER